MNNIKRVAFSCNICLGNGVWDVYGQAVFQKYELSKGRADFAYSITPSM
ncbi:MAG: hypothetical protein Q4A84_03725 [Neisseria sp.]|nr:hypothetical protein [Neisseria sp.]MDO4640798.1 hypothetical protein [Neisseria sp.]